MSIDIVKGNDVGLKYLHPSVTSTINSEQTGFTPSNSLTSFFYTIVSEKGEDGKVNLITSKEEFVAKYGAPNMRKYGQAAYNIINLLTAGAEVYVLRVLPENAGFAHAFINIQAKKGIKKAKNSVGAVINADNVSLRTCVSYSTNNNVSLDKMKTELKTKRPKPSIDGYMNHLIAGFIPIGRGSAYNNLGIRLSLNNSYDEVYDFRIYNFEVITFDEYGIVNVVEGPYYVSFDPNAISTNNESMFIEDVVNKYSKLVKCIFNENAYNDLTRFINPNVSPSKIDILSGQTRLISGQAETYFDENTQNYEDVHFSLHKYDINGIPVVENGYKILNISDPSSKIEDTSLSIDNAMRISLFDDERLLTERMKGALSAVIQENYDSELGKLIVATNERGSIKLTSGSYKEALDTVTAEYKELLTSIYTEGKLPEAGTVTGLVKEGLYGNTDGHLNLWNSKVLEKTKETNTKLNKSIEKLLEEMKNILPYIKIFKYTKGNAISEIENRLNRFIMQINKKEIYNFRILSIKDAFNDLNKKLIVADTIVEIDEEIKLLLNILTSCNKEFPLIEEMVNSLDPRISGYYEEEQKRVSPIKTEYDKVLKVRDALLQICKILENEYISEKLKIELIRGKEAVVNTIDSGFEKLLVDLINGVDKILQTLFVLTGVSTNIEMNDAIEGIGSNDLVFNKITTTVLECLETYKAYKKDKETNKVLLSRINDSLSESINKLSITGSDTVINFITDLEGPIKFDKGTDGDLEFTRDNKKRTSMMTQLLSRGYKGLIDPDVTNRAKLPFKYLLDANFPTEVKNAMINLARDIRRDLFAWMDTEFCPSPQDAINWRMNEFPISTQFSAIFTQDYVVYDDYSGRDMKVAFSYFLALKIPFCATQYGLHYPIAGSRRGVIDGYKENSISFIPNELYKEQLYNRQINYVESDSRITKIGSQLTSDAKNSPLSNINNVLTILDIKRDIEALASNYQFEFNDAETETAFQYELNQYLERFVSNRSCEDIKAVVYASDYDKSQKVLRVKITIKFNNVIERIVISLDVVK